MRILKIYGNLVASPKENSAYINGKRIKIFLMPNFLSILCVKHEKKAPNNPETAIIMPISNWLNPIEKK